MSALSTHTVLKRLVVAGAVAVASVAAPLVPAAWVSADTCTSTPRTTQQYLVGFGDREDYFVPDGGAFEAGARGWSYGRATFTVGEQESWKVVSVTHRAALRIPAGTTVSTPTLCLRDNEPNATFFFKPISSRSVLTVTLRSTKDGRTIEDTYTVTGRDSGVTPGAWKLASGFGNRGRGVGWTTTYIFTVSGDAVLIDDLLVDPNCPGCRR
jgi:hypothetical protein